ncbi:MAG TPA: GNAT family N-acetyltransferase [Candidatus Acidoferrales bacterium]|jgi:hypothetical protein|nr:GNAT family N-acetyltransferase [Candidatus Acidoferrales bacterium]
MIKDIQKPRIDLYKTELHLARTWHDLRDIEPLLICGFPTIGKDSEDFPFDEWYKHSYSVIARLDGRCIGTGRLIPGTCPIGTRARTYRRLPFAEQTSCETNGLAVWPDYQGAGVGTMIEVYKLLLASRNGMRTCFGVTGDKHQLLECLGYRIDATNPFNYGFYGEQDISFLASAEIPEILSLAEVYLNQRYGSRLYGMLNKLVDMEITKGLNFLPMLQP